MNVSFAGCGFLGMYHVGVAACFKKYAPHLIVDKVSGASAGAIAACCLLCGSPLGQITSDVLQIITTARSKTLGPFSPSFNILKVLKKGLEKTLPDDAPARVNGKLHISLTRVYDQKNVIVSHFKSKEDLIQALMCTCFIPVFCGWLPPRFRGVRYMDGGCSDNLPILDENTITVSPFCGESDICPRDNSTGLIQINVVNTSIEVSHHNLYRLTNILWPPQTEILSKMAQQGFDDSLRFLNRNNLINCARCLSVQSTYRLSDTIDDSVDYDPECHECKLQRQDALVDGLPENVVTVLQEAVESNNRGLLNWLFKYQTVKLITLPYLVPIDMVYATFLKFLEAAPVVKKNLMFLGESLMEFVVNLASKVNSNKQMYSAKFSCQLAITEYRDGSGKPELNVPGIRVRRASTAEISLHRPCEASLRRKSITELAMRRPSIKNKLNLGFTMNLDRRDSVPHIYGQHSPRPVKVGSPEGDAIEKIMDVASNKDALMAYYYLDENNQVKVTEIFDVTDADTSVVLPTDEREINSQLEFDDSYNWADLLPDHHVPWDLHGQLDLSNTSDEGQESMTMKGPEQIFSDPESEWCTPPPQQIFSSSPFPPKSSPISDSSCSLAESDRPFQPPITLSRKSSFAIMDV